MSTAIEGNTALASKQDLLNALGSFGNFSSATNLGDLIDLIEAENNKANGQVPGLTGLGGPLGRAFLDVAKKAKKQNSKMYDNNHQVIISVAGQIMDYSFTEIGTTGMGTGSLVAITYVTSVKVPKGNAPIGQPKTDAYRWTINVKDNGGGIDTDIIDYVFQPYFTTDEKHLGMGLFLLERSIKHSFGTEVEIDKEYKKGVRLIINVPPDMFDVEEVKYEGFI